MSDIYKISVDGSELARVSGERIECGKKLNGTELTGGQLVDDLKLLKVVRDGKTVAVFYVSSAENVSVEKLNES